MRKIMLFITPLFLALMACSETIQSANDQSVIKKHESEELIPPEFKPNKKSININNQKFILLDGEFKPGKTVFNLSTKEKGRIKGSIVVVTHNVMKLSKTVKKITEHTFMITPKDGQSLQQLYKQSIDNEQYTTVELQIDYSPISTAPVR